MAKKVRNEILVVDDSALLRTMIKNAILNDDDKNNIILEAKDVDGAINVYKSTFPDLVIMDVTMDMKSGVNLTKRMISINKNAKIIMISALGQEDYLKECISAGVKDFIVKPFTKERVVSSVKKVLGDKNG